MLIRVEYEAGALMALQEYPQSRISYVESGEFAVTVGDETRILHAGDSFYVAPDVAHGVSARQAGTVLNSFSPPPTEFLPPAK